MTEQRVISRTSTDLDTDYKYGFVTEIDSEIAPKGLNEDVVRMISAKKGEPQFLLDWRLKAYEHWTKRSGEEPGWAMVDFDPIDYQDIHYYAAPVSTGEGPKSLDEVDPELVETFNKLGIPIEEQKKLTGVAVDAIFDSVSVATTYKKMLEDSGVIFCSVSEAVQNHPDLVEKYLGSVVPYSDNFYATLNSAVFSDGSFVYVPPGVRCPIELMTYFRINAEETGQFERTLIVADEGSYVSYLEGCTAPMRKTHQLHAAVVELVALDDAEIKYSTLQNWYPGDKDGNGGVYNFVTKRGKALGRNSKISWTQVETGSAITWKYPSVILQGDDSVGEFYSVALVNNRQQADTGTKMTPHRQKHEEHHRRQGNLRRPGQQHLPGAGADPALRRERDQLHAVRLAARGRPVRRAHGAVHRGAQPHRAHGARGFDFQGERRPALLLHAAGDQRGRGALHDHQRLLPRHLPGAAVRVRHGSPAASEGEPGRRRRVDGHHDTT